MSGYDRDNSYTSRGGAESKFSASNPGGIAESDQPARIRGEYEQDPNTSTGGGQGMESSRGGMYQAALETHYSIPHANRTRTGQYTSGASTGGYGQSNGSDYTSGSSTSELGDSSTSRSGMGDTYDSRGSGLGGSSDTYGSGTSGLSGSSDTYGGGSRSGLGGSSDTYGSSTSGLGGSSDYSRGTTGGSGMGGSTIETGSGMSRGGAVDDYSGGTRSGNIEHPKPTETYAGARIADEGLVQDDTRGGLSGSSTTGQSGYGGDTTSGATYGSDSRRSDY